MTPPDVRPLSYREVRALARSGVRGLLEAVDDELFSAIVLSVAGTMATSTQYARIERDDTGLPRLGLWITAPELEDELVAVAARTL